jgi:hypothetical protein
LLLENQTVIDLNLLIALFVLCNLFFYLVLYEFRIFREYVDIKGEVHGGSNTIKGSFEIIKRHKDIQDKKSLIIVPKPGNNMFALIFGRNLLVILNNFLNNQE